MGDPTDPIVMHTNRAAVPSNCKRRAALEIVLETALESV